jgi:hypothetical protein
MNHAVMTEIDIEKKIKQLLKNTRITSYQLPNLVSEDKNWYVKLLMFLWKLIKTSEENRAKPIFSIPIGGQNCRFWNWIGSNIYRRCIIVVEDTPTTVKT